jgi:hypothetical protein
VTSADFQQNTDICDTWLSNWLKWYNITFSIFVIGVWFILVAFVLIFFHHYNCWNKSISEEYHYKQSMNTYKTEHYLCLIELQSNWNTLLCKGTASTWSQESWFVMHSLNHETLSVSVSTLFWGNLLLFLALVAIVPTFETNNTLLIHLDSAGKC